MCIELYTLLPYLLLYILLYLIYSRVQNIIIQYYKHHQNSIQAFVITPYTNKPCYISTEFGKFSSLFSPKISLFRLQTWIQKDGIFIHLLIRQRDTVTNILFCNIDHHWSLYFSRCVNNIYILPYNFWLMHTTVVYRKNFYYVQKSKCIKAFYWF